MTTDDTLSLVRAHISKGDEIAADLAGHAIPAALTVLQIAAAKLLLRKGDEEYAVRMMEGAFLVAPLIITAIHLDSQ